MTKLLTWNLEWCGNRGRRYENLSRAFFGAGADLWCATEAMMEFFPDRSNCIAADPDYGYEPVPGRRKAVLWSRNGWRDVDTIGHPRLPGGRSVAGTTETSAGALRVIGICIPWAAAHVSTGRRDRRRWEDHLSYLEGLKDILADTATPCVVLGDFNQAIPRKHAPKRVWTALQDAFGPGFRFATERLADGEVGVFSHINNVRQFLASALRAKGKVEPAPETDAFDRAFDDIEPGLVSILPESRVSRIFFTGDKGGHEGVGAFLPIRVHREILVVYTVPSAN